METFVKETHERLTNNYFHAPTQTRTLGKDIPMSYPDSLFDQGIGGRVYMQVRIDTAGEPQALKIVDGVHPVLDGIAQRAATKMRWEDPVVDVAERQLRALVVIKLVGGRWFLAS